MTGKVRQIMEYMEFCRILSGVHKKSRVSSPNMLRESELKVVFETVSALGEVLTVYESGEALYLDVNLDKETVFSIKKFWVRHNELDQDGIPVYSYLKDEKQEGTDELRGVPLWVSNLLKYGQRRVTHNSRRRENTVYIENLDYEEKERLFRVEGFEDSICDSYYIKDLLECLSVKQRTIVELRFMANMTFSEIAEALNEKEHNEGKAGKNSKGTVNKELKRALARIKKKNFM